MFNKNGIYSQSFTEHKNTVTKMYLFKMKESDQKQLILFCIYTVLQKNWIKRKDLHIKYLFDK